MSAGYFGLLDFTGIPVGLSPVTVKTGGLTVGAGKREVINYLLQEAITQRSVLDDLEQKQIIELFALRVEQKWREYQKELALSQGKCILSTILAEV